HAEELQVQPPGLAPPGAELVDLEGVHVRELTGRPGRPQGVRRRGCGKSAGESGLYRVPSTQYPVRSTQSRWAYSARHLGPASGLFRPYSVLRTGYRVLGTLPLAGSAFCVAIRPGRVTIRRCNSVARAGSPGVDAAWPCCATSRRTRSIRCKARSPSSAATR